jgi:predicted AlkP superfamily phosphohydrolase/phosphomutase
MRNCKDTTYDGLLIATSLSVQEPAVGTSWVGGLRSLLIGVPPGYPPRLLNDSDPCFLTPPTVVQEKPDKITYPAELWSEVDEALGGDEYIFDVPNFRNQPREFTLQRVFEMTERRFRVARHLVKTKPWDYFMLVEMGPDRLHHMFWQFVDPAPAVRGRHGSRVSFRDYYLRARHRGRRLLLEALPRTWSFVVSDHGGRPMQGACSSTSGSSRRASRRCRAGDVADADQGGADRLGAHRRVGRRRLLRPAVPQCQGARARRHRGPLHVRRPAG